MHSKACKDVVAEVDLEAPTEVPEASSSREESPALGGVTRWVFFYDAPFRRRQGEGGDHE